MERQIMNIYLISQSTNDDYDTYDSAVVIAKNEEQAQKTHPSGQIEFFDYSEGKQTLKDWETRDWTESKYVDVQLIGKALDTEKPRVVCASFNAG